MKADSLQELYGPERILADIQCDSRGSIERLGHLDEKLAVELDRGASIEQAHPAFVGAIEALSGLESWSIPLLEWAPDIYVALQLRRIGRTISVRIYDFSAEASALRAAQQRIYSLRTSPPPGYDPAKLPEVFTDEITACLRLFTRDQSRVISALERFERSAEDPSSVVPRRLLGRVLHADDDLMFAALVRVTVENICTDFQWVGDGRQAVRAFEHGYYDYVILDFSMPELDGVACAEEISRVCADLHASKLPVLILLSNLADSAADLRDSAQIFTRVIPKSCCLDLGEILPDMALKGTNLEKDP